MTFRNLCNNVMIPVFWIGFISVIQQLYAYSNLLTFAQKLARMMPLYHDDYQHHFDGLLHSVPKTLFVTGDRKQTFSAASKRDLSFIFHFAVLLRSGQEKSARSLLSSILRLTERITLLISQRGISSLIQLKISCNISNPSIFFSNQVQLLVSIA